MSHKHFIIQPQFCQGFLEVLPLTCVRLEPLKNVHCQLFSIFTIHTDSFREGVVDNMKGTGNEWHQLCKPLLLLIVIETFPYCLVHIWAITTKRN
ncbi:hypothetical protein DPMN_036409 [Dreissena polymorpha]|uniref:Uncharacterized protein n=1 Tax=Dreissena polymorpha TaxID=45954 RepID=A0A9D4RNT3_DREPO|nr:hypothetical protein DPMN_036409 [Dreissena polymorpha]